MHGKQNIMLSVKFLETRVSHKRVFQQYTTDCFILLPPPLKKKKVEEMPNDIPDVLQGEIARLDQRFKVRACAEVNLY
jgi:hypothetical protein